MGYCFNGYSLGGTIEKLELEKALEQVLSQVGNPFNGRMNSGDVVTRETNQYGDLTLRYEAHRYGGEMLRESIQIQNGQDRPLALVTVFWSGDRPQSTNVLVYNGEKGAYGQGTDEVIGDVLDNLSLDRKEIVRYLNESGLHGLKCRPEKGLYQKMICDVVELFFK